MHSTFPKRGEIILRVFEYFSGVRFRLLLLVLVAGMFSFKHPFYLGVTELKYSESEKTMQVTVKLFTNDLEDALAKIHGQKPDLINGKDKNSLNKILDNYVGKHLLISVNKKLQTLNFLGFEHENDAIWMYLEIQSCPKPKTIDLENSLLYDLLKGQTNIVHCEIGGQKKSSKLSYPEKNLAFSF